MRITFFTYGAMGDFLMLRSLASALRRAHPGARITGIATRNERLLRDMARGSGIRLVNLKNPLTWAPLIDALMSDAVVLPPAFGSAPPLFKRLGRALAWRGTYVGFADRGEPARFDRTLTYDIDSPYYENMLRALAAAGFPLPAHRPAYDAAPVPGTLARLGLKPRGYILVHPFASNAKRSFPPRRWQALIDWLAERYPETQLVVTCGPSETAQAESLARGKARVLPGEAIDALATLMREAALYIGVDTGVTHLAAMVRAPSVVIGNLSNPSWLPRYNDRGVVLYDETRCTCRGDKTGDCAVEEDGQAYFRCLYDISDERLHGAIAEHARF